MQEPIRTGVTENKARRRPQPRDVEEAIRTGDIDFLRANPEDMPDDANRSLAIALRSPFSGSLESIRYILERDGAMQDISERSKSVRTIPLHGNDYVNLPISKVALLCDYRKLNVREMIYAGPFFHVDYGNELEFWPSFFVEAFSREPQFVRMEIIGRLHAHNTPEIYDWLTVLTSATLNLASDPRGLDEIQGDTYLSRRWETFLRERSERLAQHRPDETWPAFLERILKRRHGE